MGVASKFFNSILSAPHLLLQTQNYFTAKYNRAIVSGLSYSLL
jgi:hypothetical protein